MYFKERTPQPRGTRNATHTGFPILLPRPSCQQLSAPQRWHKLFKKLRRNCPVRGSPGQGPHFRKSFLILAACNRRGRQPSYALIPTAGTQQYVADVWDGNQETYFLGIECSLSSCAARVVGKPELWLLGLGWVFYRSHCPTSHETLCRGLGSAIRLRSWSLLQ